MKKILIAIDDSPKQIQKNNMIAKQSAGFSYNYKNDFEMLEIGMKIYDALYSWAKYVSDDDTPGILI